MSQQAIEPVTQRVPRPLRAVPTIPRFDASVSEETLTRALREHGCAIVERFLPEATEHAKKELAPYLEQVPTSLGSFTGYRTRRTMRLVAKSMATHEMIDNPLIQGVVSSLFRGEAYHHQIHFTMAVRIEPGEKAQSLHRDDTVYPFRHPSPPTVINTIFAVDDFTAENGATQIVPGSHRWQEGRTPRPEEVVSVVMERGSVLLFDGGVFHGGGENRTDRSRTAIILGYSLGWLRPSENPQLAVPPHVAKMLSPTLVALLGYRTHGFLGMFEGNQATVTFSDPLPEVFPADDLYTPDLERLEVRKR